MCLVLACRGEPPPSSFTPPGHHLCPTTAEAACTPLITPAPLQKLLDPDSTWFGMEVAGVPDHAAYITALYWAGMTLTTIGFGDITPETSAQRVYVTCVMLVGGFMYGYIIGAVSALLASAGERRHKFFNTMKKLNHFLSNRLIPSGLRFKLRQYFR